MTEAEKHEPVAVVTGGSSGIGRATALAFARAGTRVLVADIDDDGGEKTVELVRADGGECTYVRTDVGDHRAVDGLVACAVDRYGRIDVMFNNAGIGEFADLLEHTPEQYDRVIRVNQNGVFYGIVAAGRAMRDLGIAGTIVNTASVLAFSATRGVIGYQASKGAVKMMTQAAALELAPHGIRCIAIAPGGVETPIIANYLEMGLEPVLSKMQMRGKLLQPESIARVVVWLCSPAADCINGSTIMCDDGFASFKT
jgi:glucose 1-dehydrogenase